MKPRDFVLLAIKELGGSIQGKTRLQKQLYFVEALVPKHAGLGYRAHYYGPYSPDVEDATDELWSIGLLNKRVQHTRQAGARGFEMIRYDFELTEAGKRVADQVALRCANEAAAIATAASKVLAAGDLQYMELAAAAKAHYILRGSDNPLTDTEISETAQALDCQLGEREIDDAVDFLVELKLANHCE